MKHTLLFAIPFLLLACSKSDKAKGPPARDAARAALPLDAAAAAKAPAGPFTMKVTPAAPLAPEQPASLTIELLAADGSRVTGLAIAHEKLLHLIVVSGGLQQFAHIHPEQQPDGTLKVEHTFPIPGPYLLFGDFTPEGGPQAVARAEVDVPGMAKKPQALKPTKLPAATEGGSYDVMLSTKDPLAVGEVMLAFAISKARTPVTDLQPYLGARGHCVIISEDGEHYLHSHPTGTTQEVEFHTTFPEAGRYKLWAEFRPNGEPLLVSYVIEVTEAGTTSVSPDAGMHPKGHDHSIDAGVATTPKPDAAPTGGGDDKKLAAAEQTAWAKAKPVFEAACASCHTADGAKKSAKKLAKFDMSAYPFTGKKASVDDMRKVLGLDGGKATMPKGKVGSVKGADLAAIKAWCDAYEAAHAP